MNEIEIVIGMSVRRTFFTKSEAILFQIKLSIIKPEAVTNGATRTIKFLVSILRFRVFELAVF